MQLPELCIRRPVMTTLLMAGLLVFGIIAYRALPVSELPNVDFPTISVEASLPGASPETMAASVATPLEGQFATIAGIQSMTSTSSEGLTRITLQFALDRDIDGAAQDVQAAIAAAQRKLPPDMPSPPTFRKVNPADFPIFYLAMTSSTLPLSVVDEYAETRLAQRLSTVTGVAQVLVYGSQKYAVRIQANPDRLAAMDVGIDELEKAIQSANVNKPTGSLQGPHRALSIATNGQLENAAAYRPLIVAYRKGSPVRLDQVAHVLDSVENNRIAGWYNGQRAVVLAIQRQPGTNTIDTVDRIKRVLPVFQSKLPASIKLDVLYDRTVSIRQSVDEVQFTLVLAACLVILVIFLFLRNLSATIIPSLALPISIIGTFAAMYLLGYSVDNLSLLALTLSVGFVVDDAIVMLENIVRHIENGENPLWAAMKGAREIGFTILSMTLSLVAVFIPVLFMGGVVGRLLHEFAVTICCAILVSGFISLTLTPMLASRFLRSHRAERHGRLYRAFEWLFDRMLGGYERTLRWALRHRFIILLVFLSTVAGTVYVFRLIPKGFIPNEDSGRIVIFTRGPVDISFRSLVRHQLALAAIVGKDPSVAGYMSFVGAGGSRVTANTGLMFLRLKPLSERPGVETVIQRLRHKLRAVPGIRAFLQNPPPIRIGGHLTSAQYQYTLQDTDLKELYHWSNVFEDRLRTVPGFQDVTSDLEVDNPTVTVSVDRDKLSALGLTMVQVEDALGASFGSRQVSTIYTSSAQYEVILEMAPRFQRGANDLNRLYLRSSNGQLVPLSAVATLTHSLQALTVNHQDQLPAVTLSFNLAPGVSLGDAVARIQSLERDLKTPASLIGSLQGTAQAFQSSIAGLGVLLLIAVLVVYIVLGILYESFIHPLTILSGLPAAGLGALLTLLIFHQDLNLYAFVGVIMLIGIVKKNAIMMIDFALTRQRAQGMSAAEAIYDACRIRFRPIMMTTMAALMGTLPIAVGVGAGAESRQALGLAVVGGLVVSQLLTLYLTPVIYVYMDRLTRPNPLLVPGPSEPEGGPALRLDAAGEASADAEARHSATGGRFSPCSARVPERPGSAPKATS